MKIHFIGIGGIGVSALAKYYLKKGQKVSGSDLVFSEIIQNLKELGARIFVGKHYKKNLPKKVDMVIYSPAVKKDNPELKEAYLSKVKGQRLKVKIMSYPEALGELTKKHFTIAVSGTHGKSTTTAMIGLLLTKAGFDPTVIVGTKLKEFGNSTHSINSGLILSNAEGSNCRVGKNKYLVIEADEWQASFLNYWPKIIVLTNIEKEHLDYYKNLNHILKTYKKYIGHLPKDGVLVANEDDNNIQKLLKSKCQNLPISSRILDEVGTNDKFPIAKQSRILDKVGTNPKSKTQKYSLKQKEVKKLKKILKVPGEHNVYNALAALTVARILKIPDKISFKTLSEYKGSWRRFEIKKAKIGDKKFILINDYGHHPTEIEVTLRAAREKFLNKKIWCVFQPHQYQRTFYLFNDFVRVFSQAPIDNLIITDIYDVAGREKKEIKKRVSSKKLIEKINKPWAIYLPKGRIKNYLKNNLVGGEIIIIMGAGDIYQLADEFSTCM